MPRSEEVTCRRCSRPGSAGRFFGAGGLGTYAVQYAKLLSSGASVVVFARSDEKLLIAKEHGADFVINTRGKSLADIRSDLTRMTGQSEIYGAIDCVGAEETIQTGLGLLATAGAFVSWVLWVTESTYLYSHSLRVSTHITDRSGETTQT
ncbi:zinc-binding dehydrogenase [Edaphobacter modestus]|uniref:zinc-binding dehydrogenase n=1 Tax=Edaphobacter modestus TaxID=388466 RepID=UPI003BF7CE66